MNDALRRRTAKAFGTMTPTVSVILPTYNRSGPLRRACASVLGQSFRDLELIVVDDASTENIAAVVASLSDARARLVRREVNGGAAAARNTGLKLARGAFIAFQDSDDVWLPDKLEREIAMLLALPDEIGVVLGAKILCGRDARHSYRADALALAPDPTWRLKPDEDQVQRFLMGNRLSLQNALFRRSCHPGSDWFDPCAKANNDWEFAARLAQCTRIHEHGEPTTVAFISGDSISRNKRKKAIGLVRILKKNRGVLQDYPAAAAYERLVLARYLRALGKRRAAFRQAVAAVRASPPTVVREILCKFGLAASPSVRAAPQPAPRREPSAPPPRESAEKTPRPSMRIRTADAGRSSDFRALEEAAAGDRAS